ncbi:putative splicing factor 3b subunit 2 [Trichonephila clavata]|uniref:Putative splicing factor 3b subunit 2 n=1 Tax=Trichonephila clavata TaxID=2740835 RepID=A0A8X6KSH2_TRICU|nr:putative splicing factor 3b subunit 2 [Trichonephila clavata]
MEVPQAIEKVLVFKGERAQMLSVNPDDVAQPVIVGGKRRKRKKLSRRTVAELQQKVNLKASSNIIRVLHHWCFKGKQDKQDNKGIENPPGKLHDCIKQVGIMKMGQALRERDDQKTMKAKMWEKVRFKSRKSDI